MILLGFESGFGRLMGLSPPERVHTFIFNISPLRTGRVRFCVFPATNMQAVRTLEKQVETWGCTQQYAIVLAMDSCSQGGFQSYWVWPQYPDWIHHPLLACAIPREWEGMPKPQTLVAILGHPSVIRAGLMGPLPRVQLFQEPPGLLTAKPGDNIEIPSVAGFPDIGGSIDLSFTNIATGRSSASTFAFNPGERVSAIARDKMPALNPRESLSLESGFSPAICDIRSLTHTDEGARMIYDALRPALDPKIFLTRVEPTDCLLVDTEMGIAQVLGDDLSYEGVVVSGEIPPVRQLKGTAPETISLPDETKFLRLDFSRPIALCQDRTLLSSSSTRYEHSKFPTLPTPFMVGQRAMAAMTRLAPQPPWEGLPVPRFLAGPRIGAQVG